VEAAVKIAAALGVSVEYLVTGREGAASGADSRLSRDSRSIARVAEQLGEKNRKFALDFILWLKNREERPSAN
jgi:hypothetical protein